MSPGTTRSKRGGQVAKSRRRRFQMNWKSHLKATKVIGLKLGMFLLLWTPYMVVVALTYFKVEVSFDTVLVVKCLHYSNSAINPILYVLSNRMFKDALRRILR